MTDDAALSALHAYGNARYREGLEDGLRVAERIVGWLTRQPDTQWQREVREWAERAIRKARENAG